ncbi:DegV family protein [Pseudarthrobacter sp. NIBRBAC000502771]|uniref:DegV family protein n=1 Tax=Pseudarthrobacter sp. NIBRBAC000502771 TaxID=2590774 RepID=UPI001131A7B3|nr:DegV family protein [Pseudarthrobacter sp. NIBRBAC000502771]QDG63421.1 DegV family protein [Pseudarthrobacter sp. NIBRBAC000502771]
MPDSNAAAWPWVRARLSGLRPAVRPGSRRPGPGAVVRTAVVTDSAAALPAAYVSGLPPYGILTVTPMPVMVGAEIYGEGEDDILETIAVALAAGTPVKTSRPSPGQFEQAYRAAELRGFDGIVSVHISGELSGTADAARLAAGRVGIPVDVVDTRTVGMAQGLAVQAAVEAASAGAGRSEVAAAAAAQAENTQVFFYVPSLEQLRRGGRIGAAASLLGTMLAIKPILAVDGGRIVPLEKVRSAARAVARLEEIVVAAAAPQPDDSVVLAVHHFGNQEEAAGLAARLEAALPGCLPAQISSLPAVLAAHAGLGVLAVIVGRSAQVHGGGGPS